MRLKNDFRNHCILIALGIFFFIPFLGRVHLFDWDEINFAEATREMIETGNYLQVQINYQPFWEKPPLFFWLQVLSMKIAGINEYGARLVNAICGIITLVVVYRIGSIIFNPSFGMLWALGFLGSFLPHLFFKSGIIDPVFNLFIFLGAYFFATSAGAQVTKNKLERYFISGIFIGLALLTKGPVALLIIILCVFAFWTISGFKKLVSIKGLIAFLISTVLVSFLWYGIETIIHGPWFITEFIKYQIRLFRTQDAGHGGPFYFHFFVVLFGCFPSSFLAIRAIISSSQDTREQKNLSLWMIIVFWTVLILFSIVKTKTVVFNFNIRYCV